MKRSCQPNFEFKLTEKKIAKDLFSLYGISTSQVYKAQFIDEKTLGLAVENSDPTKVVINLLKVGAITSTKGGS